MGLALYVLVFIILPIGFATFFIWRAYQLGIKRRVELTRQWMCRAPDGIENYASLFAWRDLLLALTVLLFLVLMMLLPKYLKAWIALLGILIPINQGFNGYALRKIKNPNKRVA
jgi:hypothetical protein